MRYVSKHPNLVLYSKDGKKEYYRFRNGVLELGDANEIDPTDLMRIYPTDLSGKKEGDTGVNLLEICGLGDLTNKTASQGLFFEAPVLTSADEVAGVKGVHYRVLTDTITYAGKEYFAGEVFATDGTTVAVTGNGTFALECVDENAPADLKTEFFKINVLVDGTESPKYWIYKGGYKPTNSLMSLDDNFYGYTK